jgi:xanthine dehydrogenase YagR molybdenum-binding subunit
VLVGGRREHRLGIADLGQQRLPQDRASAFLTPRHNHNAIEPHAATIIWKGDELTIHDTTQMVTAQAATIADVFDLKPEQVRVISPYVGGGFGSKGLADHQILGAAAAKLVGRPVRVTLSREGVYRIVGGRTLTEQRVAIGAQADGHFSALIHTGIAAMTAHNNVPEPFIMASRSGYAADSFRLSVETLTMNMLANIFMRAPGESVGTFALESAIDELAIELEMDPIELRIRNEPDKDPTSGLPFSSRHIVEAWRSGAERFGWDRRGVCFQPCAGPGARRGVPSPPGPKRHTSGRNSPGTPCRALISSTTHTTRRFCRSSTRSSLPSQA